MNTLLELAERVEKAEGPDRELDLAIWRLIDPKAAEVEAAGRRPLEWLHRYTSSLDDAMTLVPEGWRIHTADFSIEGRFSWMLEGPLAPWVDPNDGVECEVTQYVTGAASAPALGLTAAALRARAAQEVEPHAG